MPTEGDKVAVGIYPNRVVAWRVGTNPSDVVYEERNVMALLSVWRGLEEQGFQVVIVFQEFDDGGVSVALS